MHLASRLSESDSAHYTPRAQLFAALKQRKFSGENFSSLLTESQIHRGLASGDANQPLKEVDEKSPQSFFQISLPVPPPNACPEESEATKHVNISAQSQLSVLSDDYSEIPVNAKQVPKSLLFYQLKRVPTAVPPVCGVEDKLSDSQTTETVSQSSDSSGILAEPSVRSTVPDAESTKTLSELLNPSNSDQTECIKYTPGKSTVGQKSSGLKRKSCKMTPVVVLNRISQSEHSIARNDSVIADDSHEKTQFSTHTYSPFKSQQVLDESKDFHAPVLVWSTLVLASSVSQDEDALDKMSSNQEIPYSYSGVSVPNLLPSAELLSPKTLASELESNSVNDCSFSRKTRINVRHTAPLSDGKDVCFSRDVQIQSSSNEKLQRKPMSRGGTSSTDQSVCRNVVDLEKWSLRLDLDQHLSLAGYRKDEPGGALHCSDPVTQCLRKDMVQTTSGMVYHLSGRLCKSTAAEAGLSTKFLRNFLDGFPPNWEDLLNSDLKTISSRTPDSYFHVEKILEKTKPLSASAKYNRGSSESVKKVKSAAALNAKILSSKGSKNDPLTLEDLPVTRRSGRMVIPPLAWWANHRVMVDPTGNATVIAQENENRLDLPAVHFKSGNKISSVEIGEKPVESSGKDFEKMEQKALKDEKQSVETSSKKHRGRPCKRTDEVMQEMEVESSSTTDAIDDRQGIGLVGGQLQEGGASANSVICSLQRSTRRGQNQSNEVSELGFHDSRGSHKKQEKPTKTSRSCNTSAVDTTCHSAQKRKTHLKNCRHYQLDGFSSTDCPQSSQVPQQTSPQTYSRRSLTINRKRSNKSDLTEETSRSSRHRKSCNVESDRNGIKVPVQHGTKVNKTLTLRDSKVIRNSEKLDVKSSVVKKLFNRKEKERSDDDSEGTKETRSDSVGPPSCKIILRNENTGENGEQKKLMQRRSSRVRSLSHKYRELLSMQQRSRLNSDSEEGWLAEEQSAQKRTKKHSIKDLGSRESAELVYTKSDHLQKTVVMRHDSKKRRERATKDQFSFLTVSPLLMQYLPPKPRPSQFHASGNLSDLCDSDDSAKVEYFFSSDDSET